MRKWNIKFSGAHGEDPVEFIKSINEGRGLLRVDDQELLQCLPFLMTGVARNWFRSNNWAWRNFAEFEKAWISRFSDPDFQYTLYDEIRRRTQHQRERITDFLTNIRCMMDRLEPPLPESKQIAIAIRNMIPQLSITLSTGHIISWVQLERAAARMERSIINAKQYRAPPSADESMLPSLAYHDGNRVQHRPDRPFKPTPAVKLNAVLSESENYHEEIDLLNFEDYFPEEELSNLRFRANANTTPRSPYDKTRDRCYKCGDEGHYSKECPNPRKIFCRDCGKKGVRRLECPDCPKIKELIYCKKCGLVGVTSENCKCSEN